MAFIPGKTKFECQYCLGWYLSDQKKIRYDNLIVCKSCWSPKPEFMHKPRKIGNELAPPNNPSPQSEFQYRYTNIEGIWMEVNGIDIFVEYL